MEITNTSPAAASCPQSGTPFVPVPSTHATGPWQAPTVGAYGTFRVQGFAGSGIEGVAGRVSAMRDRLVVNRTDASAKLGRPPRGELR